RLWPALAMIVLAAVSIPAKAQMFSDRPPPVPPAAVPDPGAAINLAPSTGPASAPPTGSLPPALTTQPSMAAVPPVNAPQGAAAPGQAVLSLSARYGKDLGNINGGLVWRVFPRRPGRKGHLQIVQEG